MSDTGERTQLLAAAEEHDGFAAFSEAFVRGLERGDERGAGHQHLERRVDGALVGLAALAPDGSAELVVHPDARRRGLGKDLAAEVLRINPAAGLWAHGNLPGAQATASSLGLVPTRELYVMEISGEALIQAADVRLPEGVEALPYPEAVERYGVESVEQQWLEVNNDAFSWHPEQGGWDLKRLRDATGAAWYSPEGVWFLYEDGDMAGFHWTKQHSAGVGEVYVVGLSSAVRGRGLGTPVMGVGLKHLVGAGVNKVILYVESDNERAVRRYRALGFRVSESHVVYAIPE
ncbi:mycothiol synthase [Corynebacterium sp.]|uniref:mycothiol synthase n=1 Tax=Corynebacterium sp. TaxID=1720 RepID=UPI002A91DA1D|nr:mycothiol synthase [Corynebacterium sp.]MDY5786086.1 mycothiol synthase [Corynebacterium sp.]